VSCLSIMFAGFSVCICWGGFLVFDDLFVHEEGVLDSLVAIVVLCLSVYLSVFNSVEGETV